MNLSAPFISQFFKDQLMATVPYWCASHLRVMTGASVCSGLQGWVSVCVAGARKYDVSVHLLMRS